LFANNGKNPLISINLPVARSKKTLNFFFIEKGRKSFDLDHKPYILNLKTYCMKINSVNVDAYVLVVLKFEICNLKSNF